MSRMVKSRYQCKMCFRVFWDVQQSWQRVTPSCPFCLSVHYWVLKDDQLPFLCNSNNTDFKKCLKDMSHGDVFLSDFEIDKIVKKVKKRGR